jgi:hypothetical protein
MASKDSPEQAAEQASAEVAAIEEALRQEAADRCRASSGCALHREPATD